MTQHNALVMGIVNLTPDSFSDGGHFNKPQAALDHCYKLLDEGADILDLGAESTRPGAKEVSLEEEWQRLAPILDELSKQKRERGFKISVDSYKKEILTRSLDLGLDIVNNVQGLLDFEALKELGRHKHLSYICMHMHETPETMQKHALVGDDAVLEVERFFAKSAAFLLEAGFSKERFYMDPGIGFGKDDSGNLKLLAATSKFSESFQLCIGLSRKSFIGRILELERTDERDAPSKMLEIGQILLGAKIIRTHAVGPLVNMLKLLNK